MLVMTSSHFLRTFLVNETIVIPLKPTFYKRFVDDIYRGRKRNEPDELFDKMNSCHPNIKLTIEIIPKKILRHQDSQNFQSISVFYVSKRKQKTDSLEFSSTKKL